MPIPKGITREHVLTAMAELDAGAGGSFGDPTGYYVVKDGKRYPPKAVIGLAARHVTGRTLAHGDFSSGNGAGQAVAILRRLDFPIVSRVRILTWNPESWEWGDLDGVLEQVLATGSYEGRWSTGNTINILPDERFIMLKQGDEGRGIFASGVTTSKGSTAPHYHQERAERGDTANRVRIRIDRILDPRREENLLDVTELEDRFPQTEWHPPASGTRVTLEESDAVWDAWLRHHARASAAVPFVVGQQYKRADVYRLLDVPRDKQGGNWATGYTRWNGDWFLFPTVGAAARTGHNYDNRWDGERLVWYGKTKSRPEHQSIRSIISPESRVFIFTRDGDRAPFTFRGRASPLNVAESEPVKIVWRFGPPLEHLHPDEAVESGGHVEGAVTQVTVNKYERDPVARAKCINHWGTACLMCGMDLGSVYGPRGIHFIHVHHVTPLGAAGGEHEVDPIRDLMPVCPNCHGIIHRFTPALLPEQMQDLPACAGDALSRWLAAQHGPLRKR